MDRETRTKRESWDNLDREIAEFEKQMRRALNVVQDHRYLLGDASARGIDRLSSAGVTRRKVDGLVRYVRQCRAFVRCGEVR